MKAETFHELDYVEQALLDWARYMRADEPVKGFPRSVPGLSNGGASQSFEDMCDAMDMKLARTVDAVIRDLHPTEQAVLMHTYLAAVWRFNRADAEEVLVSAKENVRVGLKRKGYYLGDKP